MAGLLQLIIKMNESDIFCKTTLDNNKCIVHSQAKTWLVKCIKTRPEISSSSLGVKTSPHNSESYI